MAKKILILNGSPRLNGNTHALIEKFSEGAKESGNEAITFDLIKMKIHGCLGCYKGGKDLSSPCVQKDDMEKIYPSYRECDILVLASPMYYWSISGELKCAFDRLFAVAECDPHYENPKKDVILLVASEGDTEDNFKPLKDYYLALLDKLGWKNLGYICAGGNVAIGDITNKVEQLNSAYELGKSIK